MVDPKIAAAFQPYLSPGERLVWTGRPDRALGPQADAVLIPFGLMGLSALLFSLALAAGLMAAGAVFVAVRLALCLAHRRRTVYARTDRRALELRRLFGDHLLSEPLA